MKKLLFFLITGIILLIATSNCYPQWIQQGLGVNVEGYGIGHSYVVDPQTVWALGYGLQDQPLQSVLTTNGGYSWIKNPITGVNPSSAGFLTAYDANHAWIYFQNTSATHHTFKRTIDGGQNWISLDSLYVDSISVSRMWFTDTNTGYVISRIHKQIFHTQNGGMNWQILPGSNFHGLFQTSEFPTIFWQPQYFTAGLPLYVCTSKGRLLISWNNGILWQTRITPFYGLTQIDNFRSQFTSSMHGYIWDDHFHFAETLDGGLTWQSYLALGCNYLTRLELLKWVPGTFGTFVCFNRYSLDGGRHWTVFTGIDTTGWSDFFWANNTTGWLAHPTAGPNLALTGLYKYNGILLNTEDLQPGEGGFYIYPIPSNGIIRYRISSVLDTEASLSVRNSLGQVVFVQKLHTGIPDSEMLLDLTYLPKGMYIATLLTGDRVTSKKILLE